MGDTEFSTERLLKQASGNQSALFFVTLRWARDRDGSVDKWATFVGEQFADSWADMRGRGAYDVARTAGLNFASSADSKFASLTGDERRAEALIEGPDPEWLKEAGVSAEDSDRANELIFRPIARSLGMSVEAFRDDAGLHLVFAVA